VAQVFTSEVQRAVWDIVDGAAMQECQRELTETYRYPHLVDVISQVADAGATAWQMQIKTASPMQTHSVNFGLKVVFLAGVVDVLTAEEYAQRWPGDG
jgi:hypothetical protein